MAEMGVLTTRTGELGGVVGVLWLWQSEDEGNVVKMGVALTHSGRKGRNEERGEIGAGGGMWRVVRALWF